MGQATDLEDAFLQCGSNVSPGVWVRSTQRQSCRASVEYLVSLSTIATGYNVNPVTDLIPVCPNRQR